MLREKSERRSLVTIRLSETCIVRGSDGVATLPRARPVASRGPEIKYPLENEAREKAARIPLCIYIELADFSIGPGTVIARAFSP